MEKKGSREGRWVRGREIKREGIKRGSGEERIKRRKVGKREGDRERVSREEVEKKGSREGRWVRGREIKRVWRRKDQESTVKRQRI